MFKYDWKYQVIIQIFLLLPINMVVSIKWCALFFTFALVHIGYFQYYFGFKKAMILNIISCFVSLAFFYNKIYIIKGNSIEGLCQFSYLSIFLSFSIALIALHKWEKNYSNCVYEKESFISPYLIIPVCALSAILLDGTLMMIFFSRIFSITHIISIFFWEVLWKSFFVGIFLLERCINKYIKETKKEILKK